MNGAVFAATLAPILLYAIVNNEPHIHGFVFHFTTSWQSSTIVISKQIFRADFVENSSDIKRTVLVDLRSSDKPQDCLVFSA